MWLDRLKLMKKKNQSLNRSEWTTEKISQKSGVPIRTLDKIFAGTTKDPKLLTMKSLVYTLGYSLDDLFSTSPLGDPGTARKHTSFQDYPEISEAYANASEDDKAVVDAVLKKYLRKKNESAAG